MSESSDWERVGNRSDHRHDVVLSRVPTRTALNTVLALARRSGRPVSARLVRNKKTLAPLGCAVVTCRSRADARELAANWSFKNVKARCCDVRTVLVSPPLPGLRDLLEQVGDVLEWKVGDKLEVTYDGPGALCALAVLDGAVFEGKVLKIEEKPLSLLRRPKLRLQVNDELPKDKDALTPQRFECAGEAWAAGAWPDARRLWDLLAVPKDSTSKQLVVLVLAPVAAHATRTVTVDATLNGLALRGLVLARDGKRLRLSEPVQVKRDDVLLCLFDRPSSGGISLVADLALTRLSNDDETSCDGSTERVTPGDDETSGKGSNFDDDDDASSVLHKEPSPLGASLLRLFDTQKYCDVTLVAAQDVKVEAHRVVLAARSGFFSRHFEANPSSTYLCLNAEPAPVIAALCCFAYADALVGRHAALLRHSKAVKALLDAAARYEVDGLADYVATSLDGNPLANIATMLELDAEPPRRPQVHDTCRAVCDQVQDPDLARHLLQLPLNDADLRARLEKQLCAALQPENVAVHFELAETLRSDRLRDACLAFAKDNIALVMAQPCFTQLLERRADLVFDLLAQLQPDK